MLKLPNNGSDGNDGVCIWAKDKCSSGSGNDNNTDVLACENSRFFSHLASKDVGEEERLRLSDRNSIMMK